MSEKLITIEDLIPVTDDQDKTLTDHIGIGVNCNVVQVDDVKQTFNIFLDVHCHYLLPLEQAREAAEIIGPFEDEEDKFLTVDDFPFFIPSITVNNCLDLKFDEFKKIVRVNKKTGYVWVQLKNFCSIFESLDLHGFPYDRQLFKIEISTDGVGCLPWHLHVKRSDCSPAVTPVPGNNVRVNFEAKNWKFLGKGVDILDFSKVYLDLVQDQAAYLEEQDLKDYDMKITLVCDRDYAYYFYNYILLSSFLVYGISSVFLIPANVVEERQNLSLTILLAMVALKFALTANTPVIGYNTRLDKFLLVWYSLLFLVLLWNNIMANIILERCDNDFTDEVCISDEALNIRKFERILDFAFIAVWVGFTAAIIISGFFKGSYLESLEKDKQKFFKTALAAKQTVFKDASVRAQDEKVSNDEEVQAVTDEHV